MSERKILVELYVDTKQPIAEVGRLTAEMQRNKVRRDELLLISRKQRDLTVSEKRELGQLISVMKAQSNALRELTNLTSGATAAGLRFRDKMAEAARAGLGAFGLNVLGISGAVTGLVTVFRGAVTTLADFEQGLKRVEVVGADYKANIEALGDAAVELGVKFGFGAVESVGAVEELAKAGVSASKIIGGGLEASLSLAAAGNVTLAEAAETAASSMNQFNLEGSQLSSVADALVNGADAAQGGVDQLRQALAQGGLVAKQFGLDLNETVGGLTLFAANGLLGSDAGTSFRTMLLRLAKPTDVSAEALEKYNIQAYDASGNFIGLAGLAEQLKTNLAGLTVEQRNNALTTIFGQDAIRGANILFAEGAAGVEKYTELVSLSGTAQAKAAELTNTLTGANNKLKASWDALITQGGALNKVLTDLANSTTSFLAGVQGASDGTRSFTDRAASATEAFTFGLISADEYTNALSAITFGYFDAAEGAKEVAKEVAKVTEVMGGPTAPAPPVIKTVKMLRAELAELKTDREELAVTDAAGLRANQAAIDAIEKQIAAIDGKTKKVKELTAAQKEQIELEKMVAGLSSGKDAISKPLQSLAISPDKDPRVEHEAIVNDLLNTKYQENAKNYENAQDLKLEAQEASLEASGALAGSLAGLFDQQSEEFKAFAVIEALISTYLGAARALADNTIPNTFARIAAASAVVLTGLAAVKRIQGFEEGGYTDRASSNKKAVGVVHANEYVVPAPILKTSRGKALVDELEAMRMRHPIRTEIPFVSGGRTTRGSALVNTPRTGVTSDTIASADLARAIANMPTPIVRVTDINDVQGAVARTRVTASL